MRHGGVVLSHEQPPVRLDKLTSPEVAALLQDPDHRWGAVIPVGSLEQHGPSLPLGCDTAIARGAAETLARALLQGHETYRALVLPDVAYAPVPGAEATPGTISVGFDWLGSGLQEILRGVLRSDWDFAILLNAHAQNHGRTIEAGMAATGGTLGRKLPVLVIHLYEYASLCDDLQMHAGSHAGAFELALFRHYGGEIRWDAEPPTGVAPRPRPGRMFGLDLMPRSDNGVLSDAPIDRDAVMTNSGVLGRMVDAALLECVVTDLDLYFENWSQGSPA